MNFLKSKTNSGLAPAFLGENSPTPNYLTTKTETMKRKIYIGETYLTESGEKFTVAKVEQGKAIYKNSGHKKGNSERIAIDENGNRKKISNLKEIQP